MDRVAAARGKNGANNLAAHDRINHVPKPIPLQNNHLKKALPGLRRTARKNNHYGVIDPEGSFRDET
jgi:hypothetical protein